MANFEMLDAAIKEINKLCETAEKENRGIEKQILNKKEERYTKFCTDLAPYLNLYRENGLRDIVVDLYEFDDRYDLVVCFHAQECYLCFVRKTVGSFRSMYLITRDGEFNRYESGYLGIVDVAAKYWTENPECSKRFDADFIEAVQVVLSEKARYLNEKREELEETLATV